MIPYFFAVVQGIVEGLTEFLPVSSTGHLILAGHMLSFNGEAAKTFEVFIQLGAILAVAFLYRRRIGEMLRRWKEVTSSEQRLTLWHIGLAMLPAMVTGLLLHKLIKAYLFSPLTVLIGLVLGGLFMIFADKRQIPVSALDIDRMSYRQALGIGLFQCLSLWPGFSRSGATIAGGLLLGASYRAATEFSFLLAIPIMVAATSLDLIKSLDVLSPNDLGPFSVGFVVSFLVAWLAVVSFLKLLERLRLTPFAWYRFLVAAVFGLYFLF